MFYYKALVFFAVVFSGTLTAQLIDSAVGRHSVQLRTGLNQVREDLLLGKVHTGVMTECGYVFEKRDAIWRRFKFAMGYSRIKSKLEDLSKTINLRVNAFYGRVYRIYRHRNFQFYTGPEAGVSYSAVFFSNWDDSHLYWGNYLSLGLRNSLLVPLRNDCEWLVHLALPVISAFSRPPEYRLFKIDEVSTEGIAGNLHSGVLAGLPNRVFYLQMNAEYRFPVLRARRHSFGYHFEYSRIQATKGKPFAQIVHTVGIAVLL